MYLIHNVFHVFHVSNNNNNDNNNICIYIYIIAYHARYSANFTIFKLWFWSFIDSLLVNFMNIKVIYLSRNRTGAILLLEYKMFTLSDSVIYHGPIRRGILHNTKMLRVKYKSDLELASYNDTLYLTSGVNCWSMGRLLWGLWRKLALLCGNRKSYTWCLRALRDT